MQEWYMPMQRNKLMAQTITVTGRGTVTAKPDTVIITLGVRTEHANVQEALVENAKRANAVIHALKAIGVSDEDIDTASFSIYPKYNYSNGTNTLTGYEVEHIFDIIVKDTKKSATFTTPPSPAAQTSPVISNSALPTNNLITSRR